MHNVINKTKCNSVYKAYQKAAPSCKTILPYLVYKPKYL